MVQFQQEGNERGKEQEREGMRARETYWEREEEKERGGKEKTEIKKLDEPKQEELASWLKQMQEDKDCTYPSLMFQLIFKNYPFRGAWVA